MFIRFSLLVLFALGVSAVKGQGFKCGTVVPSNSYQLEQNFLNMRTAQAITTCLNKVLSIRVIIVTDSTRATGVPQADIDTSLARLNRWFKPICLSFQICDIDTVYSYKYNLWHKEKEHDEFQNLYAQKNVINWVLVQTIEDPSGALGYAPLGNSLPAAPRYDMVVLQKANLLDKTVPHEMGHFFGLYHTFETDLGNEFVNGSNCATTGDLLCDTPADIDPAPIGPGCVWSGTNRDANNDYYTPILGNIMSYHPDSCPGSFTVDQYNRMIYNYLNNRNYLY